MAKPKDLTGKRFGKLKVIHITNQRKNRKVVWECLCDCGNMTLVATDKLQSGLTKSCGCLKVEKGKMMQEYNTEKLTTGNVFKPNLKRKARIDNQTGVKGLSLASNGQYVARIGIEGRNIYLGRFNNIDDAIYARKNAEEKYHKPYLEDE